MGYIFKSIDAATATGPGQALVFDTARYVSVSVQFSFTGGLTGADAHLERSLDGVNWDSTGNCGGNNGIMSDFSNFGGPVLALRANISTLYGSAGTATIIIAAVDK